MTKSSSNLQIVSLIVPTRNSAKVLDACLASIKNQIYPNIEIIVVDRDSTDSTKEIARKYTGKVFNYGSERSEQRNYGAEQATGEYIVFIDSDMQLSPSVIGDCVSAMVDSAVQGVIIPEESFGEGFWAQCKKLERSFYVGVEWMEAARFFRKQAFKNIGGYDVTMVSGEDWDLSQRIGNLGKIGRIPSFIFHDEGRISLWKDIKKKYYYAQKFLRYTKTNENKKNIDKQTSLMARYMLFFSRPEKLFEDPLVGLGMIFMKTLEFGLGGIGYISSLFIANEVDTTISLPTHEDAQWPIISFIIPTYNAEKYFELCLSSIKNQDYPKDKLEILIIDGGSSDKTITIAKKYGATLIHNEKRIAEFGKTLGILKSKGEYFILLDSDNELVEGDWTKKMVLAIRETPNVFGIESPLSHDIRLSSLNRYFGRMRIADPLAKLLANKPVQIQHKKYADILGFKKHDVLITGANGFIWNKQLVLEHRTWEEKFEEANYSTYIHNISGANYGIAHGCSVRHYYCEGLSDYAKKRKKIALKMKNRLEKRQSNVWVNQTNKILLAADVLYLGTFVGPLGVAGYKSLTEKTLDWLWHPVVSLLTIWVYLINFI